MYEKIWILLAAFFCCTFTVQCQSTQQLELVGQVKIPFNYMFKETPVGGLSGLSYESDTDTYYLITDDRSEFADARFYSFKLQLGENKKLERDDVKFQGVHFLKKENGEAYLKGRIDSEGIAISQDSLIYVSSEGAPNINAAPFINAYGKSGSFVKALTIPDAYWQTDEENDQTQGVRANFGFEGLAITPDGSRLYAGTENALLQDGPAADSAHSSPARIIVYEVPSGDILHEYRYDVAPVHIDSDWQGGLAVNGLTALVALNDDGHLLSLDRNYVAGQGTKIKLYKFSTSGATDIKGMPTMPQDESIKSVRKELVADLSDYNITLDNFEGLVLGPALPDGGRLLLIVSDNNFSKDQQTLFTLFRLNVNQIN